MFAGIALFYVFCTGVGFIFALLGAVFGELHSFGEGGVDSINVEHSDADIVRLSDSEMPDASIFNTITISTFIGFFGISGLIGVWVFGLGPVGSLIFAFPTALIIAIGQFVLYVKYFVKAQSSSEATLADIIGKTAEVITTIPEGKIGEIAYIVKDTRYTAPAKASDDLSINSGTQVVVLEFKNNIAIVQPFEA
ncbi:MAG: NfeD family protein [Armatimonadota bacterium]